MRVAGNCGSRGVYCQVHEERRVEVSTDQHSGIPAMLCREQSGHRGSSHENYESPTDSDWEEAGVLSDLQASRPPGGCQITCIASHGLLPCDCSAITLGQNWKEWVVVAAVSPLRPFSRGF
jgi:hypothetical protein